ncbi:DUF1133 family protein [Salmonella enterica]
MIYAKEVGRVDEGIRLNTLESVWIRGRLRMWGRWAGLERYGRIGNMFNMLLSSHTLTRDAVRGAMKQLENAGCSRQELEVFLNEILQGKQKTGLAFCTDEEGRIIDRTISETLHNYPALKKLIADRYRGRGRSVKELAERLNVDNPHWCFKTCQRRIDVWLNVAESMLYAPVCDAFGANHDKFTLPGVQKRC